MQEGGRCWSLTDGFYDKEGAMDCITPQLRSACQWPEPGAQSTPGGTCADLTYLPLRYSNGQEVPCPLNGLWNWSL